MLVLDAPRAAVSSLTLQPNLPSSRGPTHAKKLGAVAVEGWAWTQPLALRLPACCFSLHLLQAAEPTARATHSAQLQTAINGLGHTNRIQLYF